MFAGSQVWGIFRLEARIAYLTLRYATTVTQVGT